MLSSYRYIQSQAQCYSKYAFQKFNTPATHSIDFDRHLYNTLLEKQFFPQYSTQICIFNTLPNTGYIGFEKSCSLNNSRNWRQVAVPTFSYNSSTNRIKTYPFLIKTTSLNRLGFVTDNDRYFFLNIYFFLILTNSDHNANQCSGDIKTGVKKK